MILKSVKLVIYYEDKEPTLMAMDLKKFMSEIEGAPDDTPIRVETGLFDGETADIIHARWRDLR